MSHQAELDGPTPAWQQYLVYCWLQAEVQRARVFRQAR